MFRLAACCAERCVNRERGLLAFRMAGYGYGQGPQRDPSLTGGPRFRGLSDRSPEARGALPGQLPTSHPLICLRAGFHLRADGSGGSVKPALDELPKTQRE